MKEYRYSEEKARKTIKSQTVLRIPLILVALLASFYIANSQSEVSLFSNSLLLIFTLPIIAVTVTIGLLFGIKAGTKTLLKNVYRISDDSIEWITPFGKSVNIDFNEIVSHKSLKKGLYIKSQNQKILIPESIDEFDEITSSILNKVK